MSIGTILLGFLGSSIVGFVCAAIGGAFIATPIQIANNPSPAFYISGFFAGISVGKCAESEDWHLILFGITGALGGLFGWFVYRILVFKLSN